MSIMIAEINGFVPQIEPVKMDIVKEDLYSDSSGRTAETGDMLLYPIRFDMYSIDLEYLGTASEISIIEEMIQGCDFYVRFLDCGEYVERYMYPSGRTKTPVGTRQNQKYRLSFSLIETRRQ